MTSRHPRLATLPDHLFREVTSFRALEARIATLPEELMRGDAFEVFVEAYLHTHLLWQVSDLWLVGQVPLDVRRALNLPADASGIDGVFRTRTDAVVPYQVKFRIGRPRLGLGEVATFLGVTERTTDRVLITNTDEIAPTVADRDHLRVLRGRDFDDLGVDEWTAIGDWVSGRPPTRPPRNPRPHQMRALAACRDTLRDHARATVVMPCGTGKTLVELWVAEQQTPSTVLVLVPSLSLLSQTLSAWGQHTAWGDRFEYLCVCSDPTVSRAHDALVLRSTDVPFTVDTDPAVVRRFLDRPSTGTVRVVFSTYQSARVVADGARGLAPFDIGIFDEAHKTAGREGGGSGLALTDAHLPIRRRLFFTATPRRVDIRHRDTEGDFSVVSMDDAAVYGPRAFEQTFAEAVAEDLICDYRVVVSVVDPAEVSAFAVAHGITLVEGDQQSTRWVSTLLSVQKAIQETGATKVITFHSRVADAQAFAGPPPRGIQQHVDGFVVHHVNGEMRVTDRKDILAGFSDSTKRLVTNARCLTEGIDLPAVDMVVFSSPRKSRVDIVQAIGRAMRKPREGTKTRGFVVVPVLLGPHDTDDVVTACANTDWEDVVDVLSALRDEDARLDDILREQQVAKGRGDVFDPRMFADRVTVLGPQVSLEVLERHIASVILDRLGVTWDQRYGELVAYQAEEGHCVVPARYPENPALGGWVGTQRRARRAGALSDERIARLNQLGFVWDPADVFWELRFAELVAYRKEHGHCNVTNPYPRNLVLGRWVNTQRVGQRGGTLSDERIARLNQLGFVWERHDAVWEEHFAELVAYRSQHGHCNVPHRHPGNPALGGWVGNQRRARRAGALSDERIARLDALGFVWERHDAVWEEHFAELVAYRSQQGHCIVPAKYPENPTLGMWVNIQRVSRRAGTFSEQRIARLDALGFVWEPVDALWEQRFAELVAYQKEHGHCIVPTKYPENPTLGSWVSTQRVSKRAGTLSEERIARLDALGFLWNRQKRTR